MDPHKPQQEIIDIAAKLIKNRELVAFPTETVYGLGAGAFYPEAVKKIFLAKGRIPEKPLLVHVSNYKQVESIARQIPDAAVQLIENFWPGPLSLILRVREVLPPVVRGGMDTVGLRMPDHPVALALIEKSGPLAAPSANLSGRASPVTAEHVKADLDGLIAGILDAGPAGIGLESTIIDLSVTPYRILRRGALAVEDIEEVLGKKIETVPEKVQPGYSARTEIIILDEKAGLENIIGEQKKLGEIAVVSYGDEEHCFIGQPGKKYKLDLKGSHLELFSIIRDAEDSGFSLLVFMPLPLGLTGVALSMADRIKRAAGSSRPTKKCFGK